MLWLNVIYVLANILQVLYCVASIQKNIDGREKICFIVEQTQLGLMKDI